MANTLIYHYDGELERLVAAERERCAKIAEAARNETEVSAAEVEWNAACDYIADCIRKSV